MSLIKSTLLLALCLSCVIVRLTTAGAIVNSANSGSEPEPLIVCRADIVFCVDNSGSIRDSNVNGTVDNWQRVVEFLVALAERLSISQDGTQVSLVTFGNRAHMEFDLNKYQTEKEVTGAMKNLSYRGENTNTTGGMQVSHTILTNQSCGARPGIPKTLILITDGKPTYDSDKLPQVVELIKSSKIRIVTVGVTNQINETQLRSIASTPEDYVYGNDFSGLQYIVDTVLNNNTCQPVPPTTTPRTTPSTITTTPTTAPATTKTITSAITTPTTTSATTSKTTTPPTTTTAPTTSTPTTRTTTPTTIPTTSPTTTSTTTIKTTPTTTPTPTTTTTTIPTTRTTTPTSTTLPTTPTTTSTTTTTTPTTTTTKPAAVPITNGCPENCKKCSKDGTKCDACEAGYVKDEAGACAYDYCDGNCSECGGKGKCTKCKKGKSVNGCCSCAPNCKKCDKAGFGSCDNDACLNGYIHSGGKGCKRLQ